MGRLKKAIRNYIVGGAMIASSLLGGCEDNGSVSFKRETDLTRDGSNERISIYSSRDGDCSIKIDELNKERIIERDITEQIIGISPRVTYDNKFFKKRIYQKKLPFCPTSFELRDTNRDGYNDFVFHSEINGNLESCVVEQTGDGWLEYPKKINIQSYIDLDRAIDLSQKSLKLAFKGNYDGAIHLAEWSLESLNPEISLHHETLFNAYENLSQFYTKVGNKEKVKELKTKSQNLNLSKSQIFHLSHTPSDNP